MTVSMEALHSRQAGF